MSNCANRRSVFLAASALATIGAFPASAQEVSKDIIVTARRVEERLQDVPISITVFDQEQLIPMSAGADSRLGFPSC